ncbi:uncharacterized protein LOC127804688 isoform X2 [Diospyros lotus]|uniref:uncharacterized protein LOC127804688 isoform X2 n=1 Tax=Diospyros lotus TaxID=55363 RepID=UPI00224F246F|nr:uncharacterized protein LOC127804688 isoform X2 [Diospyros lotus]
MERRDEPEFNLREWDVKARMISRENTSSRRFSASNLTSFREDARSSFRSNLTISSTASSPGYAIREIDPSTYSFTTALKALQARSAYNWEWLSPEGFALNSKWNEAEKYICNPLSGEVPMECLSAKTLSGRSFRSLAAGRITMSAPLVCSRFAHPRSPLAFHETEVVHLPVQEKKVVGGMRRDVGTQSTPPELSSSSSPSPAPTPSIGERSIKRSEAEVEDSPISDMVKLKFDEKAEEKKTNRKEEEEEEVPQQEEERKKAKQRWRRRQGGGGCLSWRSLWMAKRQRQKHKPIKKNSFIHHFSAYC